LEQWVLLYNIILSLIKKLTHQPAVYAGEMAGAKAVRASSETCTVCLVGEPRERSGADPLPRAFGSGAAGAERLPWEYSL
jgi:hypothetical protein